MNITILSRNPSLYSTQRLADVAEHRGHQVFVRDPLKFTISLEPEASLRYGARKVEHTDAVISRIGASVTFYGLAVLRQFEQMEVKTFNDSDSIASSRDKLRALQLLSSHEVSMPRTVFVRRKQDFMNAIDQVGGVPVVIKLLEGTQGVGVVLAREIDTALALVELLQVARQNILIQKFVEESAGEDIRALVCGGKVIAAMKRKARRSGEFRANVHRGGIAEPFELNAQMTELAERAARVLGLAVAGVDMLESKDGPLVLEVNSSPGLEAIERVSGVDIASDILEVVENGCGSSKKI